MWGDLDYQAGLENLQNSSFAVSGLKSKDCYRNKQYFSVFFIK